jgi:hypothetical protein
MGESQLSTGLCAGPNLYQDTNLVLANHDDRRVLFVVETHERSSLCSTEKVAN